MSARKPKRTKSTPADTMFLARFVAKYGRGECAMCGKQAIVPLSPAQIRKQPDDTTHVCHPFFGGCNHGFSHPTTKPEMFAQCLEIEFGTKETA